MVELLIEAEVVHVIVVLLSLLLLLLLVELHLLLVLLVHVVVVHVTLVMLLLLLLIHVDHSIELVLRTDLLIVLHSRTSIIEVVVIGASSIVRVVAVIIAHLHGSLHQVGVVQQKHLLAHVDILIVEWVS